MPEIIELNGKKYREITEAQYKKLIILTNGWVYYAEIMDEDEHVLYAQNCKNIRRWGTTKGLGELLNGATSKTIMDGCGTIDFTKTNVLFCMNIESGW